MTAREARDSARSFDDLRSLIAAMPYAQTLGFSLIRDGADWVGRMAYVETLVGNASIPSLHGGALGALMELTAACRLLALSASARTPKTASITIEYLRPAQLAETFACASITTRSRRFANLRVFAWQDDPQRPIAAASAHFLLAG